VNIKEIKELMEVLKDSDVSELEIEREGIKVKLKRGSLNPIITQQAVSAVPSLPQMHNAQGIQSSAVSNEEAKKPSKEDNYLKIVSPMVGTFYRSPSPDAPAYINEGDALQEGKTVCIIEAMKLMNEIKSEVKGKIAKVMVENGQPVEFGQVLFLVDPS
jgi:oxaloacetate decarboxylase alpha subunit